MSSNGMHTPGMRREISDVLISQIECDTLKFLFTLSTTDLLLVAFNCTLGRDGFHQRSRSL